MPTADNKPGIGFVVLTIPLVDYMVGQKKNLMQGLASVLPDYGRCNGFAFTQFQGFSKEGMAK